MRERYREVQLISGSHWVALVLLTFNYTEKSMQI